MKIRRMFMEGEGGAGAEVFEFGTVSTKMSTVLDHKTKSIEILDGLTHFLEDNIVNNSTSAAYGGDISKFWGAWNDFQTSYAAFARYIEGIDTKVSDAAKANAGFQETANAILAGTPKGGSGDGGAHMTRPTSQVYATKM